MKTPSPTDSQLTYTCIALLLVRECDTVWSLSGRLEVQCELEGDFLRAHLLLKLISSIYPRPYLPYKLFHRRPV